MSNPFFKNFGPFKISQILNLLNLNANVSKKDFYVNDIKDLNSATINDISFFNGN